MGAIYSKFNVFSDSVDFSESDDFQDSGDFVFCCCPNRGVDLNENYRKNDTDYGEEYIGVI